MQKNKTDKNHQRSDSVMSGHNQMIVLLNDGNAFHLFGHCEQYLPLDLLLSQITESKEIVHNKFE
jgi:hypothetical protein